MKQQLNAYVPESFLLDEKQECARRVCHEDLLIVDPADGFHVLVARGSTPMQGKRLDKLFAIPSSEMQFLRNTLSTSTRVLLMGGNSRALLIFGDLLRSSGILLVLSPHADASAVARLFNHMGRSEFVPSPALSQVSPVPHSGDDEIYEQLTELFFYLDRILSPSPRFGLRTKTHLIANFAGCILDDVAVPLDALTCPTIESERLVAFLFCAFLSLRMHDRGASAKTDERDLPVLHYRVEPIADEDDRNLPPCDFPFLALPAFRRFTALSANGNAPTLEAHLNLSPQDGSLRAGPLHLLGLRLVPC